MNDDLPDPFNPTLRRLAPITEGELLRILQIPSATLNTSVSSPRPSAARAATDCGCGGLGWIKDRIGFDGLVRCTCGRRLDSVKAAKRLGDELGDLAHCTFDAFDLSRPFTPMYLCDGRYYRSRDRIPRDKYGQPKEHQEISEAVQATMLPAAYDRARAYVERPRGWLCLHGAYGGGKSHLAAAIAHYLVARDWSVRYRSVPGMLDAIKAGFKDGTADDVFDDLLRCDLLVLDDLGAQHISGYNYERLFRLINERLHLPTVITTNVHPDDLGDASDVDAARLASRIAGAAESIWLPISDYRRIAQVPS